MLAVATLGLVLPFAVAQFASPAGHEIAVRLPPLNPTVAAHGREVFTTTCIACHGVDAKGVVNLGKDLTKGFALSSGDDQLVAMIVKGRQPGEPGHTGPIPMPPKGGRPDLTSRDIGSVVVYLRSLQDPSRLIEPLPTPAEPVVEPAPPVPAVAAASDVKTERATVAFDVEAATRGKKVFNSCLACHGKNATGVPNLGADLVHSTFIASKSDEELIAFIKRGRLPTDPETRLKLTMPPKGGNPALNDKQLADVVAYLRSLQVAQTASR